MTTQAIRDVRLGQGVVAAVLHVAAVGARGSRELAMELDAVHVAAHSKIRRGRYGAPFDASFCQHLSLRAFAHQLPRPRMADLALEPLHAGVKLLRKDEPELLTMYGDFVMAAASAAADVKTEDGLLKWRRIDYSERRALDQIRSIVTGS